MHAHFSLKVKVFLEGVKRMCTYIDEFIYIAMHDLKSKNTENRYS